MKYKLIILAVVGILGFLIWKNISDKKLEENITDEQSIEGDGLMMAEVSGDESLNDANLEEVKIETNSKYSYENRDFGFAVDLSGLKMTQREDLPPYISALFLFGVGDQSEIEEQKRVPNTMGIYIWNDELEFNRMKDTGLEEKSETVNGEKFNVFSFTNEDTTSYHYTLKRGGNIYDIGVLNKKDISKFYFLK